MSNSSGGPLRPKPGPASFLPMQRAGNSVPSDRKKKKEKEKKRTRLLTRVKETSLSTNGSLAHKRFLWRRQKKRGRQHRAITQTDLIEIPD